MFFVTYQTVVLAQISFLRCIQYVHMYIMSYGYTPSSSPSTFFLHPLFSCLLLKQFIKLEHLCNLFLRSSRRQNLNDRSSDGGRLRNGIPRFAHNREPDLRKTTETGFKIHGQNHRNLTTRWRLHLCIQDDKKIIGVSPSLYSLYVYSI
jgi:hypothetical protein